MWKVILLLGAYVIVRAIMIGRSNRKFDERVEQLRYKAESAQTPAEKIMAAANYQYTKGQHEKWKKTFWGKF